LGIHHEHVRQEFLRLRDGLAPIARKAHDLHVVLSVDDHLQALAHCLVVVGKHDAQLAHSASLASSSRN
jgi:hypothetical protein